MEKTSHCNAAGDHPGPASPHKSLTEQQRPDPDGRPQEPRARAAPGEGPRLRGQDFEGTCFIQAHPGATLGASFWRFICAMFASPPQQNTLTLPYRVSQRKTEVWERDSLNSRCASGFTERRCGRPRAGISRSCDCGGDTGP